MTTVPELQAQVAALQLKINVLQSVGEDTFPLNTVALLSSATSKWFYRKTAEESWLDLNSGKIKQLREWILEAKESPQGYFEVYILTVPNTPYYASS